MIGLATTSQRNILGASNKSLGSRVSLNLPYSQRFITKETVSMKSYKEYVEIVPQQKTDDYVLKTLFGIYQ
jgi:hypothetical protein